MGEGEGGEERGGECVCFEMVGVIVDGERVAEGGGAVCCDVLRGWGEAVP